MEDKILAYLYDIKEAAHAIANFVKNKTFEEYQKDDLLRSGVERKFEIIGEALNRISKYNPSLLSQIEGYRDIVSFRNILAHGLRQH